MRDAQGRLSDERLRELAAHQQIKMFELKLSQGAKPGKGGILPGIKVTEEVARIRGIPVGHDSISPNGHPEVRNVEQLLDMIGHIRAVTGKPVGFKLVIGGGGFLDELCRAVLRRGPEQAAPDFITLDSGDGGSGAAPQSLMDHAGLGIRETLPAVVDTLREYGLRERIRVIAAGKLILPVGVAWALCVGADFVVSARGFMFALGCIQAMQCNRNTCPTGITTHNPDLQRGLDPADKTARVAHYVANMVKEVGVIAHSCGVRSPRDLRRTHARIVTEPAESKELLAAFGVPVVRGMVVHSPEEAVRAADVIGYPVALKILSPEIAHKTDAGGVRLGRADARSVHDGYVNMRRDVALARPDARLEGVLVEPMVRERHARELMVGVVRDAVFGPAILFGLGGTMVEVIRDRAVALPPLNTFLARDLVRRTRANLALQPLRGAPAAARMAVEDILLRVSGLVCELPEVGPIDLNPVVVSESGALVIDARIGVRRSPPDARPYTHMAIHPYPTDLEWPLELPGGELATIRPIRPEDAGMEQDFVARLSEQSRFLRFMFGLHALTPTMLARFTQIDYDRELALVVVRALPDGGEQQVGVARYITLADEETCEFAIVVSDEWQGKGVARRLFARLIDAARQRRLRVMTGFTLRENSRMLDLARSLGFETHADAEEPELVRMTLAL